MVREIVDAVYRAESRRVLATLIRLPGEFELAEDALHDVYIGRRASPPPRRDSIRPLVGLELIDAILARGDLADYHLAHSARADLCRLGKDDRSPSFLRTRPRRQEPERRFLERRLRELG